MMTLTIVLQAASKSSGGHTWVIILVILAILLLLGSKNMTKLFTSHKQDKVVKESSANSEPSKKVSEPTPTVPDDSLRQQLSDLKELLDAGVISQEEYDSTKSKLLNI